MTTVGWSALGSLIMEVLSESNTLYEGLAYTNVAIAVCCVIAALIVITRSDCGGEARPDRKVASDEAAKDIQALVEQVRCAESRARLLALAQRFN
jgi:hypothetical protein